MQLTSQAASLFQKLSKRLGKVLHQNQGKNNGVTHYPRTGSLTPRLHESPKSQIPAYSKYLSMSPCKIMNYVSHLKKYCLEVLIVEVTLHLTVRHAVLLNGYLIKDCKQNILKIRWSHPSSSQQGQ